MLSPPLPDIWDSAPLSADCCAIACRAMIAARIVGDVLVCAVFAARDMTAKRRGSTALNRTHDFELVPADVPCVCGTPDSTMVTEDIRDLQ